MIEFRVVDVRTEAQSVEQSVAAQTPIDAAKSLLGIDLVRSGSSKRLACKVYWNEKPEQGGVLNMLRLYERGHS